MTISRTRVLAILFGAAATTWGAGAAFAQDTEQCAGLPSHGALKNALTLARNQANGGFNLDMWATVVNRDGLVCAVAFTGSDRGQQWPGSRVISAQKGNTANAFSLPGLARSTANLYSAVQPGGSLYGLQHSNPVDPETAYFGNAMLFGGAHDPLVGNRVGGVNVFGGGLVLLAKGGIRVGGVGVSGDTSCTDHMVAWHVRHNLNLDHFGPTGSAVGGVAAVFAMDTTHPDNIIFDITPTPDGGLL